MFGEVNTFVLSLLFVGAVALLQGGFVFSHRDELNSPAIFPFLGVTIAAALWSLGYAMQLSQHQRELYFMWGLVVLAGITLMAATWPLFVFCYTGLFDRLDLSRILLVSAVPVLTFVGLVTNEYHGLGYSNVTFDASGPIPISAADPGPLLLVFIVYTILVDLVAVYALLRFLWKRSGIYRRQAALLLVAGVLPLTISLLTTGGFMTFTPVDLTPVSFAVTTVLIGWALYHYRLLNLVPIARDQVLEEMKEAVVVIDTLHRVVDLNPAAAALFDTPSKQCLGTPLGQLWPEGSAQLPRETGRTAEVVIKSTDLAQYYDVTISHIEDKTGEWMGCVLHLSDITERRTSQRRFQALIENTTTVVGIVGIDGRLTYASPSLADVLGYDPESMVGVNVFDLVHHEDRERALAAFAEGMQGDRTPVIEYRIQHQDGSYRSIESVGENHFDDPIIQGMVITTQDITEKKIDHQRLEVLNRVLRHDIRNDLTVIEGYTSLVRDAVDDPELERYLDIVLKNTTELTNVSNQARQIERTIRSETPIKQTDVSTLLRECVDTVSNTYPAADVSCEIPTGVHALAGELLPLALENLIENAFKHNDAETPVVRVELETVTEEDGGYVEIHIADNGPGIPESERRALETGTETPLEHANGLGLWLVHWIVTQMDGELQIQDNKPNGSVVTLRLRSRFLETSAEDSRIPNRLISTS